MKMNENRIIKENKHISCLIAMPNQGEIKTKTIQSIIQSISLSLNTNVNLIFTMPTHTLFLKNRNECINKLKQIPSKVDYIMWIDNDMEFKFEDIVTLIEANKDVICVPVRVRNNEEKLYNISMSDGKLMSKNDLLTDKDEIFEIYYTGMAFMLCKTEIFENFPGFKLTDDKSEGGHFCDYVRSIGKKIYCHRDLKVGHIFETTNY